MKGIKRLWHIVFPQPAMCIICEKPLSAGGICDACMLSMHKKRLEIGCCQRCNTFGYRGSVCPTCRHWPAYLIRHQSPFIYEKEVRASIHRFKYGKESWRYTYYLSALQAFFPLGMDVVVPIPLHANRLKARSFNQSALLAQCVAKEQQILYEEALLRIKDTKQQTGLSKIERKNNLKEAFALKPAALEKICGKRVLLIDDVFTTGSTFSEAGKVLYKNGAKEIHGLSLAAVRLR